MVAWAVTTAVEDVDLDVHVSVGELEAVLEVTGLA